MFSKKNRNELRNKWLTLAIKNKIGVFVSLVLFSIIFSTLLCLWAVRFSVLDFREALDDNAKTNNFVVALENETKMFQYFVRNPSETAKENFWESSRETQSAVYNLPNDFDRMSILRYAQTWSIKNSYEAYVKKRDYVINLEERNVNYIAELYEVYSMQGFLQGYANKLMRYTLEDENIIYVKKLPMIRIIPIFVIGIGFFMFMGVSRMSKLMQDAIVNPVLKLSEVARKIAANDFFVEDVQVVSGDEMGELTKAFNKMKFATGEYILALEEKRTTLDLLHQEELEKLEIEKRLESMNLQLLKSQIDPHFLFNTLNVIEGMANLEDATTTEKMIEALSSLFRYNLKTPDAEVLLAQEIRVIKDYMYLQKMRFGSRIEFEIDSNVEENHVFVPTFSFQPLVENAIIHGLSKKEKGGIISIKIWQEKNLLHIIISDTGLGMKKESLDKLREELEGKDATRIGIGLGNIYKRIYGMYSNGSMEIDSIENKGTSIKLIIPQKE